MRSTKYWGHGISPLIPVTALIRQCISRLTLVDKRE